MIAGEAPRPGLVAAALRDGLSLDDREFDGLYPDELRRTPLVTTPSIEVARLAVEWLAPPAGGRVLDARAGGGKLCLVGALATSASWLGVDGERQRCAVARRMAASLGVAARAQFLVGDFAQIDWSMFDAVFVSEPPRLALGSAPDHVLDLGTRQARLQAKLGTLRPGTRVVTYRCDGTTIPAGFTLVQSRQVGDGALDLWLRNRPSRSTSPAEILGPW